MQACEFSNPGFVALKTRVSRLILVAIIGVNGICLPAFALDTNDASVDSGTTKTLSGEVEIITLDLSKLREVGLDLKRVQNAARDLNDEVTLQPVTMQMQPNVIGTTVFSVPRSFSASGPVQPRKKAVDTCMNAMRPIITIMQEDVNDFVSGQKQFDLSESTMQDLKPLFDNWIKNVNEISSQFSNLEPLTKGPRYDNKAISTAASSINTNAKQLEATRKKIFRLIQKDGRNKKSKDKK